VCSQNSGLPRRLGRLRYLAASTDEKLLSPLESIIINRVNFKIVLLSLAPARAIIIGAIVEKSANDLELVKKSRM
jgi:hypothetical protein